MPNEIKIFRVDNPKDTANNDECTKHDNASTAIIKLFLLNMSIDTNGKNCWTPGAPGSNSELSHCIGPENAIEHDQRTSQDGREKDSQKQTFAGNEMSEKLEEYVDSKEETDTNTHANVITRVSLLPSFFIDCNNDIDCGV